MIVTDEDDLRHAEQARDHHKKVAAETFGAARKNHLRLAEEQETRVLAIKSRIAKRDARDGR
jgi:hypothetical protein